MNALNRMIAIACDSFLLSCNTEKKQTVDNTSDTALSAPAPVLPAEGQPMTLSTEQLPDTVESAFSARYPKATSPKWERYSPQDGDGLDSAMIWYYVRFMNGGDDMGAWYTEAGTLERTAVKMKGDARLPDAVNKTIAENYPGYVIHEIDKENDKNMDMYEVELKKGDAKAKLKILPNGRIFKKK